MSTENQSQIELERLTTGMMAKIIGTGITRELCEMLVEEQVFIDCAPPFKVTDDVSLGLELLAAWTEEYSEEVYDQTYNDYFTLLIGLGMPKAAPWESVYRHEVPLLFQEETMEVRRWYRRYGVQIEALNREPDDHIAYELEFVSLLTQKMIEALETSDEEQYNELFLARNTFLKEHLLTWAPMWCDKVNENAQGAFFKGLSLYLSNILEHFQDTVTAG